MISCGCKMISITYCIIQYFIILYQSDGNFDLVLNVSVLVTFNFKLPCLGLTYGLFSFSRINESKIGFPCVGSFTSYNIETRQKGAMATGVLSKRRMQSGVKRQQEASSPGHSTERPTLCHTCFCSSSLITQIDKVK